MLRTQTGHPNDDLNDEKIRKQGFFIILQLKGIAWSGNQITHHLKSESSSGISFFVNEEYAAFFSDEKEWLKEAERRVFSNFAELIS